MFTMTIHWTVRQIGRGRHIVIKDTNCFNCQNRHKSPIGDLCRARDYKLLPYVVIPSNGSRNPHSYPKKIHSFNELATVFCISPANAHMRVSKRVEIGPHGSIT